MFPKSFGDFIVMIFVASRADPRQNGRGSALALGHGPVAQDVCNRRRHALGLQRVKGSGHAVPQARICRQFGGEHVLQGKGGCYHVRRTPVLDEPCREPVVHINGAAREIPARTELYPGCYREK
jgi:hypothetical protein